jgi:hypothetical protein
LLLLNAKLLRLSELRLSKRRLLLKTIRLGLKLTSIERRLGLLKIWRSPLGLLLSWLVEGCRFKATRLIVEAVTRVADGLILRLKRIEGAASRTCLIVVCRSWPSRPSLRILLVFLSQTGIK